MTQRPPLTGHVSRGAMGRNPSVRSAAILRPRQQASEQPAAYRLLMDPKA
jgi:hypothetical protein